jgi:hypothetical protein
VIWARAAEGLQVLRVGRRGELSWKRLVSAEPCDSNWAWVSPFETAPGGPALLAQLCQRAELLELETGRPRWSVESPGVAIVEGQVFQAQKRHWSVPRDWPVIALGPDGAERARLEVPAGSEARPLPDGVLLQGLEHLEKRDRSRSSVWKLNGQPAYWLMDHPFAVLGERGTDRQRLVDLRTGRVLRTFSGTVIGLRRADARSPALLIVRSSKNGGAGRLAGWHLPD